MGNRFAAERLTLAQAHELWVRSDDATAFTRPDYLAQLVDEVEWWGVQRSGEVVAAWPLVRAVVGGEIGPPPFCYYVGPMFAFSVREKSKYSRYWPVFTEAFTTLVETVAAEHLRFRFSLPLGATDVRVLEWWNFDNVDHIGFTITPRYTARINLSDFPDRLTLQQSFARDRRRHITRWTATPPIAVEDVGTERLIELHDQALRRNGGVADSARHAALRRLIALVRSGAGSIIGWVPPDAEDVQAAIVVLDGRDQSHSAICVASDLWRDQGLTTWAIWQGLLRSQSLGKRWFDFCGANSPKRAADKHYYSAETALYFDCAFGQPR